MYIPKNFRFDQQQEQIAFMKQYPFATITTFDGVKPLTTHLPFVIEEREGKIYLLSHFAAINDQVNYITQQISLVVFTEPHAYISPKHYDKWESVPTWDYIAVHAYGKIKILPSEQDKLKLLEQTILFYESSYQEQWKTLSDKYKLGMIKGIVAFEMEVTEILGQKKLSQNKTKQERERIINTLNSSSNTVEVELAKYIKQIDEP